VTVQASLTNEVLLFIIEVMDIFVHR